jgi:SAM-dependent methyltransferase
MVGSLQPSSKPVYPEDPYQLIDVYYGCFDSTEVRRDLAISIIKHAGLPGTRPVTLLDLGCGTGCITVAYAAFCEKVFGVDLHPRAIELTRQRKEIHGASNVEVLRADWANACDIFPRESFDVAVCWGNSLGYTASWLKPRIDVGWSGAKIESTLAGVYAVLRKGGAFVVQVDSDCGRLPGRPLVWLRSITQGEQQHFLRWTIEYQPDNIRRNLARRTVYGCDNNASEEFEIEFVSHILGPRDLARLLYNIGFRDVRLTPEPMSPYVVVVARK